MSDHETAGFCLREGLCAEVEGDWHIYVVEQDRRVEGVFFVAGWPYDAAGYPRHTHAPRLVDAWEMNSPTKFISPERRAMLRQATAA